MKDKTTKLSRRSLLKFASLGAAVTLIYSYIRGIRFPVLSWEAALTATALNTDLADFSFIDIIHLGSKDTQSSFRAFAPEPEIELTLQEQSVITILVNNIASDAVLETITSDQISIQEEVNGINRKLLISGTPQQSIKLKWRLPVQAEYTFAAIGDTGGNKELGWCIKRAHDLGARFLLHLGDFNYQEGDYDNAIRQFNIAPIPCYVSIGNHDFNESGLVYQQFLKEIGPLNNSFSIGKTRFINIDTAASFLPYSGGQRGKLFEQLIADQTIYSDNVAFTHRPIHDPQPDANGDHDLGSEGETNWLITSLKKSSATTLLSGHIHIFDRTTYQGIDNIIVGQGLGHQDLIVNHNDISKIALGHVNEKGKVNYEFASLKMPMELHCHPRIQIVKDSVMHLPHGPTITKINNMCKQQQT